MGWTNYHCHSNYCDGRLSPEAYVLKAQDKGISSLGFSSHFPLPFDNKFSMRPDRIPEYIQEIDQLKRKYREAIELYTGFEVDYIPDVVSPTHPRLQNDTIDYTIGSVHFVNCYFDGVPWQVDGRHLEFLRGLKEIYRYDVQSVVHHYYDLTRQMIKTATPTIVGHLDKIKIQNWDNQFWKEDDQWYRNEIVATLETMQQHNCILEVNTRGLYKRKSLETFPSRWIQEIALEFDIPITLSSDAHHPDELTEQFKETAKQLTDIGFNHMLVLEQGEWREKPFKPVGIHQLRYASRKVI